MKCPKCGHEEFTVEVNESSVYKIDSDNELGDCVEVNSCDIVPPYFCRNCDYEISEYEAETLMNGEYFERDDDEGEGEGEQQDGEQEEFWDIVEDLGGKWWRGVPFNVIKRYAIQKYSFDDMESFRKELGLKFAELEKAIGNEWQKFNNIIGGDDSFNDWGKQVIARGKSFYDWVKANPRLGDIEYNESFDYCIPNEEDYFQDDEGDKGETMNDRIRICRHCGNESFYGQLIIFKDVVVDQLDYVCEEIETDGEIINGPFECHNCGKEWEGDYVPLSPEIPMKCKGCKSIVKGRFKDGNIVCPHCETVL